MRETPDADNDLLEKLAADPRLDFTVEQLNALLAQLDSNVQQQQLIQPPALQLSFQHLSAQVPVRLHIHKMEFLHQA